MASDTRNYVSIPVDKGISIYRRPESRVWILRVSRGGRSTKENLHTRRQDLALQIAHQRAEEVLSNIHGMPLVRDPLIDELLKLYHRHVELRNRPATRRLNLDNLARVSAFIRIRLPANRPLRLSDFHPEILEAFMKERIAAGIAPATVNRERSTLSSFFRRAVRRGIIRRNPVDSVDRIPEIKKRLPTTLSQDEVSRLLEEAARPVPFHGRGGKGVGNGRERYTPLSDLLITSLNCACRLGELIHIEWDDLDWDAGRIRIVNKEEHLLKDREDRVIAMNPLLQDLFRRRQKEALHPRWVFPSQAGGILDRRNLLRELKIIAKKAGVPWANHLILRHTALTALARAGAPMLVLREVAGHASSRTTENYYIGSLGGESWTFPEMGRAILKKPKKRSAPIKGGTTGKVDPEPADQGQP